MNPTGTSAPPKNPAERGQDPVVVGIGAVTFDDVVRVARHGAAVAIADDALGTIAASRTPHPRARRQPDPGVRHLHRFRCAGHQAHPAGASNPVATQPDSLPRRREWARGRARGHPRDDVAEALDPDHRPHRRASRARQGLRGTALGRTDAGGPRVRQPRLFRGPRPAGARRARHHGRGARPHRRRRARCRRGGAERARPRADGPGREGRASR